MKKVQVKIVNILNVDIEELLNQEGQEGWHFIQALGSPLGGVRFLLERTLDEDVDADSVLKAREDDLKKRFGV